MTVRYFDVSLPSPYGEGGCGIRFEDDCPEWLGIAPEFRREDAIRLPRRLVAPAARVRDEARFLIGGDGSVLPCPAAIVPGGVVLVLESPHRAEFEPGLQAIRPLNATSTQRLAALRLPDLLRQAGRLAGVDLKGRQVVLVNAVQYQCSLDAFMSPDIRKLQGRVRDRVWTEMFNSGGSDDLLARISCCEPALVLLAPTRGIRARLVNWMGDTRRVWPWAWITRHPAGWATAPRIGELAPEETLVVFPKVDGEPFRPARFPVP
jgi:hypothetical protein